MSSLKPEDTSVSIIGGGLAGSLAAALLGKKGYKVDVYEKRDDSRSETFQWEGRSINLALSTRGRKALRKAGIEEKIVSQCIPMKGRMMHDVDGKLSFMPYGVGDQAVLSAGRQMLNEELMNVAEANPNVKFHFNTSCKQIDVNNTSFNAISSNSESKPVKTNIIIGADGAYSAVRSALQHKKGIDYQQTYLPHGYKELTIPPNADGDFAMYTNALHIWPRGEFMMIALPNPDKTFTVTLFMPWNGDNGFNQIKTEEQLMNFFNTTFPDAVPLMPDLKTEYFKNPTGHLVTVKCKPWYYKNTVILGDAAHAIVPFYGQGMNCSLEDVDVLDDLLLDSNVLFSDVFSKFSEIRKPAADGISQLSHENYIEMRSSVASRLFLWRKSIEKIVHRIIPNTFIPLYTMVAFTTIPYHQVIARDKKQSKIFDAFLLFSGLTIGCGIIAITPQFRNMVLSFFSSNGAKSSL